MATAPVLNHDSLFKIPSRPRGRKHDWTDEARDKLRWMIYETSSSFTRIGVELDVSDREAAKEAKRQGWVRPGGQHPGPRRVRKAAPFASLPAHFGGHGRDE